MLYGQRPNHKSLWHLSPYEFVTYWQPRLLTYPTSLEDEERDDVHATLTDEGRAKIFRNKSSREKEELEPGVDFVVKGGVEGLWLPYPDLPSTEHFRNVWI